MTQISSNEFAPLIRRYPMCGQMMYRRPCHTLNKRHTIIEKRKCIYAITCSLQAQRSTLFHIRVIDPSHHLPFYILQKLINEFKKYYFHAPQQILVTHGP